MRSFRLFPPLPSPHPRSTPLMSIARKPTFLMQPNQKHGLDHHHLQQPRPRLFLWGARCSTAGKDTHCIGVERCLLFLCSYALPTLPAMERTGTWPSALLHNPTGDGPWEDFLVAPLGLDEEYGCSIGVVRARCAAIEMSRSR
jgi:hypothetical protein